MMKRIVQFCRADLLLIVMLFGLLSSIYAIASSAMAARIIQGPSGMLLMGAALIGFSAKLRRKTFKRDVQKKNTP